MSIRSIKGSSIKGTNTLDKAQVDSFECEYVVLAGGSGGGGGRIGNAAYSGEYYNGGGGGAGGYHTNVTGDLSGEDTTVENPIRVFLGFDYYVQVGAGGSQATGGEAAGGSGTDSIFGLIVMDAGGVGQSRNGGGGTGGCGGGRGGGIYGGSSTDNNVDGQGFRGGWSDQTGSNNYTFGAGGGVSERGASTGGDTFSGVTGGAGIVSTILTASEATAQSVGEVDSSTVYFGGGGGAGNNNSGGLGGGGNGGSWSNGSGTAGTANTGGGGDGAAGGSSPGNSGAGGSGVVILRYPSEFTITVDSGITSHTTITNASGQSVTIFKAGADNVRWS